jgi:hypothetical protein
MTEEERREIELLLPWHASGKLSAADTSRIDAAIAQDPTLRNQAQMIRDDLTAAVHANEAIAAPRNIEALMRQIAAQTPQAQNWLAKLRDVFSGPARQPLGLAAGMVAVALVLQAGTIIALWSNQQQAGLHLATGAPTANTLGSQVLVQLNDQATAAALNAELQRLKLVVVDGPKPGGFYVLRIASEVTDEAAKAAILADLQKNTAVFSFAAAAP